MCAYAAKHRVLMRAQNPNLCTTRAKCASSSTIAQGWLKLRASEASAYATPCAQRRRGAIVCERSFIPLNLE